MSIRYSSQFQQIRETLPNFPDEVIDLWLLPFALARGWPPNEKWFYILAQRPIAFWQAIAWEKDTVDLLKINYSDCALDTMRGLSEAYLEKKDNGYWRDLGTNGRKRYIQALSYLSKNGILPNPPIFFVREDGKYDILDGNHRIFAFFLLKNNFEILEKETIVEKKIVCPSIFQDVWIGRHSSI